MLGAKLERALQGRKIDVHLLTPSMQKQAIDDVALSQRVLLWPLLKKYKPLAQIKTSQQPRLVS